MRIVRCLENAELPRVFFVLSFLLCDLCGGCSGRQDGMYARVDGADEVYADAEKVFRIGRGQDIMSEGRVFRGRSKLR